MPQGIRPSTQQPGLHTRAADALRVCAMALLFLIVWAATLGPAAMATTFSDGLLPTTPMFDHGGEVPASPDTVTIAASARTAQRAVPAGDAPQAASALPAPACSSARPRRHARRRTGTTPRPQGPPRSQHRGRAPPR